MIINSVSEIDFSSGATISFLGTVIDVVSDGDGDKRPLKAIIKLESSGELVNIFSWKFEYLAQLKKLITTLDVLKFTGIANLYKETEQQLRIGTIEDAHMTSTKKVITIKSGEEYKKDIIAIINKYIPKNHIYNNILEKLVISNEKFWLWPAATKVHHAYPGGLAKHSLNVCKNAVSIWQTYQGHNLDIKLIVAGALLHDLGKVQEYDADGGRTVYGDLIPHPISGYEKIIRFALENNIDPEKNSEIIMLSHAILSHHQKLEYGSPVTPSLYEALIISKADDLDASAEAVDFSLNNQMINTFSDRIISLDGGKVFKWHY